MPRADVAGDEARRRTALGRAKMLLVLLVCAAPVVASYLTFYVLRPEGRSNYGTLIEPSRAVPADLPLTDLDGGRVSAASLKGQWLLVVVGRGGCDRDCEQRLFQQRQLREMTGRDRDRIDKLWLVTDDAPDRARPARRARRRAGRAGAARAASRAGRVACAGGRRVARVTPVRDRPDGPMDDARAAACRSVQAQARHRPAVARVGFLGSAGEMNHPRSACAPPPLGGAAGGPAEPDPRRPLGYSGSCVAAAASATWKADMGVA